MATTDGTPTADDSLRQRDFAVWVLADLGVLDEELVTSLEVCLASPEPLQAFRAARCRFGGGGPVALSAHHNRRNPNATTYLARLAVLGEDAGRAAGKVLSLAAEAVANRAVWEAARARGVEPDTLPLDDWQGVLAELWEVWAQEHDSARARYREARRLHQARGSFRQHLASSEEAGNGHGRGIQRT